MIFAALAMVVWAGTWWLSLYISPEIKFAPDDTIVSVDELIMIHMVMICLLLVFFMRYFSQLLKLDLKCGFNKQTCFIICGLFCSVSNLGKNVATSSNQYGTQHPWFFAVYNFQNILAYSSLVCIILLIDCMDFEIQNRLFKSSFYVVWISQLLILICVIADIGAHLFDNDAHTGPAELITATAFRSFLLFFGKWKLRLAIRKFRRPTRCLFQRTVTYSSVYERHWEPINDEHLSVNQVRYTERSKSALI